jgi:hypothetical protein
MIKYFSNKKFAIFIPSEMETPHMKLKPKQIF